MTIVNTRRKFTWDKTANIDKGYADHNGHIVLIEAEAERGVDYAYQADTLYKIKADDGWKGFAWKSELDN